MRRKTERNAMSGSLTPAPIGLRDVLSGAPDVVFCCDHDGRWVWVSPSIEHLVGHKPADLIGSSSLHYVFPIEDLVDEFLRARSEARRSGRPSPSNPLYNTHIDDHHFSPLGCEVWGKALARRLALLLEWRQGEKANVK